MIQNFCLGWPNFFTYAALSTSSAEAGLDVSNLANDSGAPDQGWQATTTQGWVNLQLPSQATMQAFSVHRTNLSSGATIRWRVWAGTSTSDTPIFDSSTNAAGVAASYGQSVLVLGAPVSGQMVQVDLADGGNPDGFVNVPLAYAGPIWQAARNFDASSSAGRTMQSTKTVTRGGGVIIRNDWVKRTFALSLSGIRASEVWNKVMDVDLYARRGNNVLFVPDPADPLINLTAIFGELEASQDVTYPNRVIEARGWKALVTERL